MELATAFPPTSVDVPLSTPRFDPKLGYFVTDDNGTEVWVAVTVEEIIRRLAKIERRLDKIGFASTVYVSYAHTSRLDDIAKIVSRLVEEGYFLTDYQNLPSYMEDVDDADMLLMLYNDNFQESKRCVTETKQALERKKRIIVVALDNRPEDGWLGATFDENNCIEFGTGRDIDYFFDELLDMIKYSHHAGTRDGDKKRRDNNYGFMPIQVPMFTMTYYPRRNVEIRILGHLKNVCQRPELGALVVSGEAGVGKTTIMAWLFSNHNKVYQNALLHECKIHYALWVSCYEWRDADVHTFRDVATQKAFVAKVLKVAQNADPLIPSFFSLADLLAHFQKQYLRPLLVLDDVYNAKLLLYIRSQCKTLPMCVITRDPVIFSAVAECVKTKDVVDALSLDEMVDMFEKTFSITAERPKLERLAGRCFGSPLIATMLASRFVEGVDHNSMCQQLSDTVGIGVAANESERVSRVVKQLAEATLAQMDEGQRISFNAFLFFDPSEPICSEEVALLWGFQGEAFKGGDLLKARALCKLFEKRGLLIQIDKGPDQDDRYLIHRLVHDVVFMIAKRFLKASDLEMLRLRLVTGSARLASQDIDNTPSSKKRAPSMRPPDIDIMCEAIAQRKVALVEKIFEKLAPNDLTVICGQKATKTGGKNFLHHLYHATWPDDISYSGDLAPCGVNRSYRLINRFLQRVTAKLAKLAFIDIFKQHDLDHNYLLGDMLDDENKPEHQNDRLKMIFRVARWRFDYLSSKKTEEAAVLQSISKGHLDLNVEKAGIALLVAASAGRVDLAQTLLRKFSESIKAKSTDGKTPVALAAYYGQLEMLKALLKNPVALNLLKICDIKGMTPLMLAARNGHVEVVEYLHERDRNLICIQDNAGWTAVTHAAANGHTFVVITLLRLESSCAKLPSRDGRTPLMHAAFYGQTETCQFLCENDQEALKILDGRGLSALALAASSGHFHSVEYLYEKDPGAIRTLDRMTRSPLMHAAWNGHMAAVEYLFEQDPDGVKLRDIAKWPVLMFGAYSGNLELVQFVYLAHPDAIELENDNGDVAMMVAASRGHLQVVEYLHSRYDMAGLLRNREGWSGLAQAAVNGHGDVVDYLHDKHPSVIQMPNNDERVPITLAAIAGRLHIAKLLYNKWPDGVKSQDKDGMTPVLHAVANNILRIIEYLYEEFPDSIKIRDTDGVTPLMLASRCGFFEIVQFLTEKYPDALKLQTISGLTALMLAAMNGHLEIVKYLYEKVPESLSVRESDGKTAGTLAAASGQLAVLAYLGDVHPLCLRLQDKDGYSPLMWAAANGHLEVVQFLCDKMSDVLPVLNNEGQNSFMIAAANGQIEVVKYIFERDPLTAHVEDISSQTALTLAIQNRHSETVVYLSDIL